ncbi:MAG: redoxin domain-containing protein [Desulfobacterota bacterium]|nr:redoxin domain-containing protein [Thermodesulfobacteriota bacterium]
MNQNARVVVFLMLTLALITTGPQPCHALAAGQTVPVFSLQDLSGKKYDLSTMRKSPMVVLYFFDASSRPSQEGLLGLDQLAKKYRNANLTVWGITRSPKDKAAEFASTAKPTFPILLDTSTVSEQYSAKTILPTVCIVGPDLKLMDVFQGGGKTMSVMLVRIAERKLQQKDTAMALAISEEAVKKNPEDDLARTVSGYAALKAGKVGDAEKTFTQLARGKGKTEVLGKEGLAAVYARQGKAAKALELADEVKKKAPERAYAHVVKADVLYSQNRKKEAQAEYEAATKKSEAETYQKAVAYNKLGRLYASVKDYKTSRSLYDQAVALDPYYVEAMANKGVTYEKEGKWDKALESYQQGQAVNRQDDFSRVLAGRAMEMLEYQKDAVRKERIDKLVKNLAERFREQQKRPKPEDTWTSPPMVVSFVDFQEQGGLSEREGMSIVLTSQLADQLKASGRVKVVDRVLLDRLLEELNLGSSELADPETSLKLGRVLAARVMGTGTLFTMPEGTLLTMRLIDTETTAVDKVITMQSDAVGLQPADLFRLNRQILGALIREHPLRAYVVEVREGQAMINLGSDQGVVVGTRFEVIEDAGEVVYKGKKLKSAPKVVGMIEVTKTEPGLAYCRIAKQNRTIVRDDKVMEKMDEAALKE